MAVCEPAPQSALLLQEEAAAGGREARGAAAGRADQAALLAPNVPLALAVDYRSPHSHFLPPEIELGRRLAPASPATSPAAPAAPSTPDALDSSASSGASPAKRKRGRPRVDRSSAEYVAAAAARKQAKEMAAMMNSSSETGEKRKRGRPRVDKTSPEYVAAAAARKRAKELEALERKAKRQYKRRTTGAIIVASKAIRVGKTRPKMAAAKRTKPVRTGPRKKAPAKERKVVIRRKFVRRVRKKDSGASSSTGEATPRVKRKYTRRAPAAGAAAAAAGAAGEQKKRGRKKKVALGPDGQPLPAGAEKARGRRGRRRKSELAAAAAGAGAGAGAAEAAAARDGPKKRGRPKLDAVVGARAEAARVSVPVELNSEPIVLDSDDEPGPGGESLSLDENLRALRHLHEKYAHLRRDEPHAAAAARGARPPAPAAPPPPRPAAPPLAFPPAPQTSLTPLVAVETLEDSSHSDSSSSSGSGSSSSGSSSSGSSSSSDSSDSSGDEGAGGAGAGSLHNGGGASPATAAPPESAPHDSWFGGWAARTARDSDSGSEGEGGAGAGGGAGDAPARDSPRDDVSESENESPDKSFQCPLCRKWYSTNVTLKIHRRSHVARSSANSRWRRRTAGGGRYECDCCQLAFTCRENLLQHKAEAHRGAVTVRCEVCRRCFEDERELAAHDGTHTDDERASRCGECGAQFARWDQLRRHRACAHQSPQGADGGVDVASRRHPHACHVCGKAFGHAHSLTRHLANHTKAVYRCVVCKASFARADTLAQHLNSHLATYRRLKQ